MCIKKGNPISISRIIISNYTQVEKNRRVKLSFLPLKRERRIERVRGSLRSLGLVVFSAPSGCRGANDVSQSTWLFASTQHFVQASTAGNKHVGEISKLPAFDPPPSGKFPTPSAAGWVDRAARMESTHETSAFCSVTHFEWHALAVVAMCSFAIIGVAACALLDKGRMRSMVSSRRPVSGSPRILWCLMFEVMVMADLLLWLDGGGISVDVFFLWRAGGG